MLGVAKGGGGAAAGAANSKFGTLRMLAELRRAAQDVLSDAGLIHAGPSLLKRALLLLLLRVLVQQQLCWRRRRRVLMITDRGLRSGRLSVFIGALAVALMPLVTAQEEPCERSLQKSGGKVQRENMVTQQSA